MTKVIPPTGESRLDCCCDAAFWFPKETNGADAPGRRMIDDRVIYNTQHNVVSKGFIPIHIKQIAKRLTLRARGGVRLLRPPPSALSPMSIGTGDKERPMMFADDIAFMAACELVVCAARVMIVGSRRWNNINVEDSATAMRKGRQRKRIKSEVWLCVHSKRIERISGSSS